jgi:hypothetical protein
MLIAQDRFHEARRPIYRFSLPDAAWKRIAKSARQRPYYR